MRLRFPTSVSSRLTGTSRCRLYSSKRTIKEHDVLFLRQHGDKSPRWHLTSPLRPDSRVRLSYGASVQASDLIGKNVLDVVQDSKGRNVVLYEPSLSSYIMSSPRLATPIYPHDANTIVSLLDINVSRPGEEEEDEDDGDAPLEIFEAGTGMGSLTLHLARALHAANPPVPASLRKAIAAAPYKRYEFGLDLSPEDTARYDAYLASRRAVVHTLDRNLKHSKAAHRFIRDFRRALYFPTIDFHVGAIDEFIRGRLAQTGNRPFLTHAILDLPSAHDNAEDVIEALQPNGLLILFKPSISQIGDFMTWSRTTQQSIRLERVLELPTSAIADGRDAFGAREWDVKTVTPRAAQIEGEAEGGDEAKMVQVMRPKVGQRIGGGGFVAILRRHAIERTGEMSVMEEEEGDEEVSEDDREALAEEQSAPQDSHQDGERP